MNHKFKINGVLIKNFLPKRLNELKPYSYIVSRSILYNFNKLIVKC